jgi:hypothetical protein
MQMEEPMAMRFEFDSATVEVQLTELQELLKLKPAPEKVMDDLTCLVVDVILGDSVTTVVAGETVQVTRLRFGARFEDLVAAVRATDWNGVAHILDGLRNPQSALSR